MECGIVDVTTNDKLMDSLYTDDITTYKNIGILFRTCTSCKPVLEAVTILYLNKYILFGRRKIPPTAILSDFGHKKAPLISDAFIIIININLAVLACKGECAGENQRQ